MTLSVKAPNAVSVNDDPRSALRTFGHFTPDSYKPFAEILKSVSRDSPLERIVGKTSKWTVGDCSHIASVNRPMHIQSAPATRARIWNRSFTG